MFGENSVFSILAVYTVKKANGNQRCDMTFPLPQLENPIRGSEQKQFPSTVVLSNRGSGHCIPTFVVDFSNKMLVNSIIQNGLLTPQ
jgi:hypothetical protein